MVYTFDGKDCIVDENDTVMYSGVSEHIGVILADYMNAHEDLRAQVKSLRKKISELEGAITSQRRAFGAGFCIGFSPDANIGSIDAEFKHYLETVGEHSTQDRA